MSRLRVNCHNDSSWMTAEEFSISWERPSHRVKSRVELQATINGFFDLGIEVTIARKRVRNINLRVQSDGSVHVSAPARVPVSTIEEFVSSRAAWIERARGRLANRAETQTVSCSEGSAIWLWGESLSCHIISIPAHGRKPSCSFEIEGEALVARVDERICPDDQENPKRHETMPLHAWLRRAVAQGQRYSPTASRSLAAHAPSACET